jgi:predicted amidophosphoribosyltransferase
MSYQQVSYFVSHFVKFSPNMVLVDMAMEFQVTKTTEIHAWLKRWIRRFAPSMTYIYFRISFVYYIPVPLSMILD